ncbi:unnamed protein product [Paramecium primaurelia]|uniref:Ankyrin repeat-containing domain n=1 Tax=Paramecium primaurelia TaxID=5886 RepID=A0A8S1KL77_PARPR|nr:unnamed protein product [Paramecium primaurelia]
MYNTLSYIGREELIQQIKESIFYFNPQEILEIEQSKDAKIGFINKIKSKKITKRIAATLSFDQISTKDYNRYLQVNNKKDYYKFNMQNYGVYEAALISDIEYLKENIKNKILQQEFKQSLLYTCCRSGFYECVQLLLELGFDIEQKEETNTLLQVASYYGHENVVGLLISYGANNNIKINNINYPLDESRTDQIKQRMKRSSEDNIFKFFQELKQVGLAESIQRSKDDNMIRIYRKIKGVDFQELLKNKKEYSHCYHGTQFKCLKPILDVGLQQAGTKTKYGTVETQDDYFQVYERNDGTNDWRNAIFTTPSPFYAAEMAYSERIWSKTQKYCCLIEVLIKQGIQQEFKSTILSRDFQIYNEPINIEYRIKYNEDAQLNEKIEDINKFIVISALFLKEQYLHEQTNYDDCQQLLDNFSPQEL